MASRKREAGTLTHLSCNRKAAGLQKKVKNTGREILLLQFSEGKYAPPVSTQKARAKRKSKDFGNRE